MTARTTASAPARPERFRGNPRSGAEFVARLDIALAAERFRACLRQARSMAQDHNVQTSGDFENLKIPEDTVSEVDSSCEVFEIVGCIKWFDASKGYGFICPDNGLQDVLLHITCLRAAGFQTVYEGARIICQVLARPRGLQVFRILNVDNSTAIHPSQLPERTHVVVKPESDWQRAVVKWFNRVRGFGFLSLGDDQPDVFVHMETLRRCGFAELRPRQTVEIRYGYGVKGRMVADMRPEGLSKQWVSKM